MRLTPRNKEISATEKKITGFLFFSIVSLSCPHNQSPPKAQPVAAPSCVRETQLEFWVALCYTTWVKHLRPVMSLSFPAYHESPATHRVQGRRGWEVCSLAELKNLVVCGLQLFVSQETKTHTHFAPCLLLHLFLVTDICS